MTDINARTWDRRFIRLLPIVIVAAIVSVAFGGPLDNLIAIGWLVPTWIAARLFPSSVQELLQNANALTIQMTDPDPGEMLPEYDFTKMKGVVRGKYASRVTSQPRTVRLADDLALVFPNDEAVNAALRDYLSGHTIGPKSG